MSRHQIIIAIVTLFGVCGKALATAPCEGLASLQLPNTTITLTQTVSAGAFVPPPGPLGPPGVPPPDFKALPAFCRVAASVKPTKDSDIRIEVWMPMEGWSGRLLSVGNGGFAGAISYGEMIQALHAGNATASTDTGHIAPSNPMDGSWAIGHPEKVVDFGYRGIHEMTRLAKATAKAFYGGEPRYSYFESCSNGGRQALMEAQRFPEDYNGILAGAPANYWTRVGIWAIAMKPALDRGGYIPAAKLATVARAVNAACDAQDGVSDGIVDDPRTCHFKPATLLCQARDSDKCLTAPQVAVLEQLYAGAHDAKGRAIYPGYLPGGEEGPAGWGLWIMGAAPGQSLIFGFERGFFAGMVSEKADWDFKDVEVDAAVNAAEAKTAKILNATDPNLTAFKSKGGKLILYHGWNDPALPALNTIEYYDNVVSRMGTRATAEFTRLYMVPGMQHCGGGPGPANFGESGPTEPPDPQHNIGLALQQWVEKGVPPSSIIATRYPQGALKQSLKMTRPLCPYPQRAVWTGTGSTDDAANFACKAR
jgi:hypothetical protein